MTTILVKTEMGQQAFKDRSVRLTPRQRSAFILCDGKRSLDQVLAAGMGLVREDIDQMVNQGLLGSVEKGGAAAAAAAAANTAAGIATVAPAPASAGAALPDPQSPAPAAKPAAPTVDQQTLQKRYQAAYPIATRLTGALGLRGFRLNMSVEHTTSYEELLALVPKIRSAVGSDKAAELERALEGEPVFQAGL